MSNFRISINLKKLKGVEITNVTLSNGVTTPCIIIPAAYNGMAKKDEAGRIVGVNPYLNASAWEVGENFIASCIENHKNEKDYVPPTHTINPRYSKEFLELAKAAVRKRIHAANPILSNEELEKQVKAAVNFGIGDMTEIKREAQPVYQVSQGVARTAPMADPLGEAAPDDLPF